MPWMKDCIMSCQWTLDFSLLMLAFFNSSRALSSTATYKKVLFAWLKILFSVRTVVALGAGPLLGTLLCSCAIARDNSSVTGRLCLLVG